MRIQFGRAVALSLTLAFSGCGDDSSFSPTVGSVAGAYSATIFTLDLGSAGVVNQLVLGADVAMTLAPDVTTTVHLVVPGAGENGGDLDADLIGTWTLSRGVVICDQPADTFIRDVRFTADRDRLTGDAPTGHNNVHLVLTKSE